VLLNTDNNEKRAKFDALPSPEVNSDEVRSIPTESKGYVSRVVDWLKSKGVLGQYKNDETGWDKIAVNRSSVKSVTHHRAKAGKIALLEAAPDLIKNGIFLETNPKNDNGLISHIFAGKATIDGVSYAVSYVVREDINGRRYYDHSLTKIEALDRIDDQAPTHITDKKREGLQPKEKISPVSWPTAQPAGEESTVNILKKHLCVNTQK